MLRRTIGRLYAALDKRTKRTLTQAEEDLGERSACHTCTSPACCRWMVITWPAEAREIGAFVSDWPVEKRQRVHDNIVMWLALFRSKPQEVQVQERLWMKEKIPCPFLERGRCSIYEVRPSGCRLQYNFTDDPATCADAETKDKMLDASGLQSYFAGALLKKSGPREAFYAPMPMMVAHVLGFGDVKMSEMVSHFTLSLSFTQKLIDSGELDPRLQPQSNPTE